MRIALGQQAQKSGDIGEPVERHRLGHQPGRMRGQQLDLVFAEMLVEPCPPIQRDEIAGLQHRLLLAGAAAAHEAEMAAMVARHHLQDHGALAMPPDADDRALVAPFHAGRVRARRRTPSIAGESEAQTRESHDEKAL